MPLGVGSSNNPEKHREGGRGKREGEKARGGGGGPKRGKQWAQALASLESVDHTRELARRGKIEDSSWAAGGGAMARLRAAAANLGTS